MTITLAAWLIGGSAVLLLMLLFVVLIARSMDRRASTSAGGASHMETSAATAAAGGTSPKLMLGQLLAGKIAEAAGRSSETRRKNTRAVRIAVAAAAAAIFSGGAIAGLFDNRKPDLASMTPVEISAGDLHGTLLSPRAKAPVVLIVPGSGPTDRDGNSPMGLKTDAYKLLAWGLAEQGIATVRVDKRGMFGSAAAGDPNAVSVDIYANDYRAWIDAIRAQTGRKCVWLLGHSEGALMVSAAAEGRKDVCGLILVAGMGRKMGDVIRQQLRDNPANAPVLDQALAAIDELEAGRHVDTTGMHPALMSLFAPKVQDYLISILAIDPVETLRKARVKSLIVQGRNDLQVTVEDARLLNKAPRTSMELISDMNHVLKDAPFDRAGNLATYADPSLPVSQRLISEIEDFIKDDD